MCCTVNSFNRDIKGSKMNSRQAADQLIWRHRMAGSSISDWVAVSPMLMLAQTLWHLNKNKLVSSNGYSADGDDDDEVNTNWNNEKK